MTSVAPDTDELQQFEDGTREAWSAYSEQLRELTGKEYERVESESWDELQSELRRIQLKRDSPAAKTADPK